MTPVSPSFRVQSAEVPLACRRRAVFPAPLIIYKRTTMMEPDDGPNGHGA